MLFNIEQSILAEETLANSLNLPMFPLSKVYLYTVRVHCYVATINQLKAFQGVTKH